MRSILSNNESNGLLKREALQSKSVILIGLECVNLKVVRGVMLAKADTLYMPRFHNSKSPYVLYIVLRI